MKDIIKYDLKALTGKEYSFIYCQYCKFKHRGFRLVYLFRKASQRKWNGFFYRYLYSRLANKMNIEIPLETSIGKGLTLGHPSGIVINKYAVLGENISISHGVTIGRVHSGKRQGVPTIGNHIFIGANASIVGGVNIGNDVLISPNTFVDFDVPDHSLVLGNPGIIKHKDWATKDYH